LDRPHRVESGWRLGLEGPRQGALEKKEAFDSAGSKQGGAKADFTTLVWAPLRKIAKPFLDRAVGKKMFGGQKRAAADAPHAPITD